MKDFYYFCLRFIFVLTARSFAFCHNPALQPRALIVYGCISKSATDLDVKEILRILVKALESFNDIILIEALVMCLTRIQPLLRPVNIFLTLFFYFKAFIQTLILQESPIHKALFWVAISVLQLDESSLYAAGLALLEQNLHTLNSQGVFDKNVSLEYFKEVFKNHKFCIKTLFYRI